MRLAARAAAPPAVQSPVQSALLVAYFGGSVIDDEATFLFVSVHSSGLTWLSALVVVREDGY